jgi:hypothetical protein
MRRSTSSASRGKATRSEGGEGDRSDLGAIVAPGTAESVATWSTVAASGEAKSPEGFGIGRSCGRIVRATA